MTVQQCTEVRFASFFSGGFTTMAVINPPGRKIEKRTSVQLKGWHLTIVEYAGWTAAADAGRAPTMIQYKV